MSTATDTPGPTSAFASDVLTAAGIIHPDKASVEQEARINVARIMLGPGSAPEALAAAVSAWMGALAELVGAGS